MISNPPNIPEQSLGKWLKEVWFEINKRMWTVFIPPSVVDTNHGQYATNQMVALDTLYFSWVIPHQFSGTAKATIVFIPTTTGTIDWTVDTTFAGIGIDEALNSSTATANGLAVTDDQMAEIDITSVFADVQRNQSIGIKLTLDALAATVNIHVLGVYIRYFNA